jgi:exopolysaccharide biosynthesis polyprenyl glycosylphosphotransferase
MSTTSLQKDLRRAVSPQEHTTKPFETGILTRTGIHHRKNLHAPDILIDVAAVALSSLVVFVTTSIGSVNAASVPSWLDAVRWFYKSSSMGTTLLYIALVTSACNIQGLYRPVFNHSLLGELFGVFKSVVTATLLLMAYLYISHGLGVSRQWVVGTGGVSVILMGAMRWGRRSILERSIETGQLARNTLIIGADSVGQALAQHLTKHRKLGFVVKGFLDDHLDTAEVLGRLEDLPNIARVHFIDEVFITTPSDRSLVKQLTLEAPRLGVSLNVVPDLFDGLGWQAPLAYVGDFPVMTLHREENHQVARFLKRVFDVLAAGCGLIILSPLFLLLAVLVKLDSPGPVFYRPTRVGFKGKLFTCWKLRTMVNDAHAKRESIQHLNERDGILFKVSKDPRITRIGGFLRKYSLDELPQLLNVLLGEMSLVGPRPPELSEYEQYELGHLRRLQVAPGITGLWQVTARQNPCFESYLRLDLEYIENWSFWLDLQILLRTVPAVVRGTGQ